MTDKIQLKEQNMILSYLGLPHTFDFAKLISTMSSGEIKHLRSSTQRFFDKERTLSCHP